MFGFFKNPMKGYKITDAERSRKFGVGVTNIKELIAKARKIFGVS